MNLEGNAEKDRPETQPAGQTDEYEELVKKALNNEISIFYLDYGSHVLFQLLTSVVCLALASRGTGLRYFVCGLTYYGAHLIYLILLMIRKGQSKLRSFMIVAEIINSVSVIGGILSAGTPFGIIGFLGFGVSLVVGVALSCFNFADSLDQTFLFKLVFFGFTLSLRTSPRS